MHTIRTHENWASVEQAPSLDQGQVASTAQGLDAEVLQMPGEEALAPRPRRRLLLGQRQERARAQVFDVPDALRASVKVALVEDVH